MLMAVSRITINTLPLLARFCISFTLWMGDLIENSNFNEVSFVSTEVD